MGSFPEMKMIRLDMHIFNGKKITLQKQTPKTVLFLRKTSSPTKNISRLRFSHNKYTYFLHL